MATSSNATDGQHMVSKKERLRSVRGFLLSHVGQTCWVGRLLLVDYLGLRAENLKSGFKSALEVTESHFIIELKQNFGIHERHS